MLITHNLVAMNIFNQLKRVDSSKAKSMEKLSSGVRINRASDDSAGSSISQKFKAQFRGLEQAKRNIRDGVSLIQTAEGALGEIHGNLQRMREIAVQASNDTVTDEDREQMQKEVDELKKGIDGISDSTQFNGITLLDGRLQKNNSGLIQKITFNNRLVDTSGNIATAYTKLLDLGLGLQVGDVVDVTTAQRSNGVNFLIVDNNSTLNDYFQLFKENGHNLTASIDNGFMSLNVTDHIVDGYDWPDVPDDYIEAMLIDALRGSSINITEFGDFFDDWTDNRYLEYNPLTLQIGANTKDTIDIGINEIDTTTLGISSLDVTSNGGASSAIGIIDNAIGKVSSERGSLGAYQNTLEHVYNNVSNSNENLAASDSRVEDADMAKEMMGISKSNILEQVAEALLLQANQAPARIMDLLK